MPWPECGIALFHGKNCVATLDIFFLNFKLNESIAIAITIDWSWRKRHKIGFISPNHLCFIYAIIGLIISFLYPRVGDRSAIMVYKSV